MMRTLVLVVFSSVLAACNSNELSRKQAAILINRYPTFASTNNVALQEQGRLRPGTSQDAGIVEGLWNVQNNAFGWRHIELTEKGKQFFSLTKQGEQFFTEGWQLIKPAKREVVEVTGITDVPMAKNVKEAGFKWRYVDLPEVVARYTGQGESPHDGKAALQLYDDGWRVTEIAVHETGRQPFVWTKSMEEEANREWEVGPGRVIKAKTPTRTITTYKLCPGRGCCGSDQKVELEITDANITLIRWPYNREQRVSVGYWDNSLAVGEPGLWGNQDCIQMLFGVVDTTPFAGGGALGVNGQPEILTRVREQIIQAQNEWRKKYPDIH
jgi:hypothetical protein